MRFRLKNCAIRMRRAKLDVKSQKANNGRYEGVGGVIG